MMFKKNVVCHKWECEIIRRSSLYPETIIIEAETRRTAITELNRIVGKPPAYKLIGLLRAD